MFTVRLGGQSIAASFRHCLPIRQSLCERCAGSYDAEMGTMQNWAQGRAQSSGGRPHKATAAPNGKKPRGGPDPSGKPALP